MKYVTKKEKLEAGASGFRRKLGGICGALLIAGFTIIPAAAQGEDSKSAPTDGDISLAVEADMVYDTSVRSNGIDTTTSSGVVTLSGTVDNLLAKERATMIAQAVKGVRAVVNEIAVIPISRTDEELEMDIEQALLSDPVADSYEVFTAVEEGVVTLSGTVNSWQEKELSGAVAKSVKGAREVKNDIKINYVKERDDTEIQAEIQKVLERDVWVNALRMKVAVNGGEVDLVGSVGSSAEKRRAVSDCWVAGVTAVDDTGLKVEPWVGDPMKKEERYELKSDEAIRDAVVAALVYDPRVNSFEPEVSVKNGIVTLTGKVDNLKAKNAAAQDAKNTVGVWRVNNYLKVRTEAPPTDDELKTRVGAALLRDPYIERFEIAVVARGGTVYLSGAVDSLFEKAHAADVASRIEGVTLVRNNISVNYPEENYYYWPYSSYFYEPFDYSVRPNSTDWISMSDAELKDEVESELFWSPFVDSDQVEVSAENGAVTLTGTVDSWSEFKGAAENAFEGGARAVINKLKVE